MLANGVDTRCLLPWMVWTKISIPKSARASQSGAEKLRFGLGVRNSPASRVPAHGQRDRRFFGARVPTTIGCDCPSQNGQIGTFVPSEVKWYLLDARPFGPACPDGVRTWRFKLSKCGPLPAEADVAHFMSSQAFAATSE